MHTEGLRLKPEIFGVIALAYFAIHDLCYTKPSFIRTGNVAYAGTLCAITGKAKYYRYQDKGRFFLTAFLIVLLIILG
jgi:hypothetical protein